MKKFFTHADLVVPPHHPRALVETAVHQGADRNALLAGTGINPAMLESPDARFSYLQFGMLSRNALALTNNPALGLDYGKNLRFSQMGMLGLALMSSPTVGAALAATLRHYRTLSPAWDLALDIRGAHAVLSARESIPLAPFTAFATEGLLAAFACLGARLSGGVLPVRAVRLAYSRPAHAARYISFLGFEPSYDAKVTEAEFDASLLDAPIAGADPATAALAERYCEERVPVGPGVDGLLAQARRVLSAPHGPPPDLEQLARMLQTSTRTLRRSLHHMNTSYSELLEESRRARAVEWVHGTAMTFERIAHELGFSNVRSFRRAFKRWTGDTPGAARAAVIAVAAPAERGLSAPPNADRA